MSGKLFAVVSTIEPGGHTVLVIGSHDRMQTAKPHRTQYAKARGLGWPEAAGRVCVVTHDGYLV